MTIISTGAACLHRLFILERSILDSHKKFWLFVALSATITAAVFVILASLFWSQFTPTEQHQLIELVHRHMVYVVAIIVMFIGGWIVWLDAVLYTYVLPTVQIADETLMIYTVNPSHRIKIDASRDMNRLAGIINEGADRYEALYQSVEERIRMAREEVETEKNILAAVIENLPEGMVICNASGTILLYNQKAQEALTVQEETCNVSETRVLTGPFLGLGRHIGSVIDPRQIEESFETIQKNLTHPTLTPVSFFSISGPRGNPISLEMVPILNHRRQAAGYIVTIHDLNQTVSLEARQTAFQVLSGFRCGLNNLSVSLEALMTQCLAGSSRQTEIVKEIRDHILQMNNMVAASATDYLEFHTISPVTLVTSSRPEFYDFDLFNRPEPGIELQEELLTNITYTVFDTETTGLDPNSDEIISIGAVRIVNNRIMQDDLFSVLIDPRRELSDASIKIHGIQPELLKGQPTIDAALAHFRQYADNTVLVGHNAAFDMRMFQMKETMTGIRFTQPVLDTMFLSAILNPAHRYHSIEAISDRLGLCVRGRHTALGDAMVTAEIFLKFLPLLARIRILTLGDAIRASQKSDYARIRY